MTDVKTMTPEEEIEDLKVKLEIMTKECKKFEKYFHDAAKARDELQEELTEIIMARVRQEQPS